MIFAVTEAPSIQAHKSCCCLVTKYLIPFVSSPGESYPIPLEKGKERNVSRFCCSPWTKIQAAQHAPSARRTAEEEGSPRCKLLCFCGESFNKWQNAKYTEKTESSLRESPFCHRGLYTPFKRTSREIVNITNEGNALNWSDTSFWRAHQTVFHVIPGVTTDRNSHPSYKFRMEHSKRICRGFPRPTGNFQHAAVRSLCDDLLAVPARVSISPWLQ